MKKLLLLLALSFNAEACVVDKNGYVYCPPPPPTPIVVIPAPISPGVPPTTIDFGGAKVVR